MSTEPESNETNETEEEAGEGLLARARLHAQSSLSALSNKASDLGQQAASKAAEVKDASFNKWSETVQDLNEALPIVRQAGFSLVGVDVGIGVPPSLKAGFTVAEEVSSETVEQLLKENEERTFTVMLVKALVGAWQLQQRVNIAGLKPRGLTVDIGLIPVVTLEFR